MHKQTKATMIPKQVKTAVWARDNCRCVVCREYVGIEYASSHVVRRARGGMGIIQNIVTHCREHHGLYDSFDKYTVDRTIEHIKKHYPGWESEKVVYKKYGENSY